MENMPYETFLTPERTDLFWLTLKHILFYGAPLVMISVALSVVGWVIWIVRKSIFASDEDDDDDIDVYRY